MTHNTMEVVEWSSEVDEFFKNYTLERQLSLIQVNGKMKRRTALEIWKWLAFIIKGINRLINLFKCDNVNIVTAWRPLQQGWRKVVEKGCKAKKHRVDDTKENIDTSLKDNEEKKSATSISCSKLRTPRHNKGWVKRLIIRGMNGKGPNKRGIMESNAECCRPRLTQKRRRIGHHVGWVKQQQKEIDGELGLRAFLRPEECYTSDGDSNHEISKRNSESSTTTAHHVQTIPSQGEIDISTNHGQTHNNDEKQQFHDPALQRHDKAKNQLLPDELVDKVLGKLPLTSILCFRSVCRRWQSQLSPDGWCTIFPRRGDTPTWTACPALFTSGSGRRRRCAFYDVLLRRWSCIFLDFLPNAACQLLTASGGLLCLCFSGMNSCLFVCNPLTRSWRALPSFNHSRRRAGAMIVHMLVQPETGAYKVILIGHPTCTAGSPSAMTEVFDSETSSWTVLANMPTTGCTLASSVVLRNGVLYCLTEFPTGLLAFNLARKVWRRLEIKSHFRVLFLFEHRGHILLVAQMSAQVTRLGIWRLRESFPRVWLKVALMPGEYASYFLKSGKLQCFGNGNLVCFASPRRPQWLLFDLPKRLWSWGLPMHGLDQDNYNQWFFYEPRVDVQA